MSTMTNYISWIFMISFLNILNPIYPTTTNTSTIKEVMLVENAELSVSIESEADLVFFSEAIYDDLQEELVFVTNDETVQIRVYDALESMVYLLPVDSKKIKLGRSLFNQGDYRLIFDVGGDRRMYASKLVVH